MFDNHLTLIINYDRFDRPNHKIEIPKCQLKTLITYHVTNKYHNQHKHLFRS